MKLLVISHMYPSSFSEVEGIFVHEQVKELIKQGCTVKVISPVPMVPFFLRFVNPKWLKYSQIPLKSKVDSVEVYYPRFLSFPKAFLFQYSGYLVYFSIKKLISRILQDYDFDLIHAHVALQDGFAAALIKEKIEKPLVVTIHGKDLQRTIHRNNACKKAIYRVFQKADRIIFVSSKLKKIAENFFGSMEKMVTIGNGIPVEKLKKILLNTEASDLSIYSSSAKTQVILSVSNLIPQKGIEFNIKALHELIRKYPGLVYLVIGCGPDLQRLQQLVIDLQLTQHVRFLGSLSHEKTLKVMSQVDIFSMPSWNEAFGVVYIEAMAFGKPVIGCLNEGIEDVIKNKINGYLVKPQDVNDLVAALDSILSNPEEARQVGLNARRTVFANFTWELNARKNIEVFQEIIAKGYGKNY